MSKSFVASLIALAGLSFSVHAAIPNIIGAPPQVANSMAVGASAYRDGEVYQYRTYNGTNTFPIFVARYHARVPADSILAFSGASPDQMKDAGQIAGWNLYSLHSEKLGTSSEWRFACQTYNAWVFLVYCPDLPITNAPNLLTDYAQFLAAFDPTSFMHAGIRTPNDAEVLEAISQLKMHWRSDPYSIKEDAAYKRNKEILLTYAKDNLLVTSVSPFREWMDPLAYYLEQKTLQLACLAGTIQHGLNGGADGEAMLQVLYHPLNSTGYTEEQIDSLRKRLTLSDITNHLGELPFTVNVTNFVHWSALPVEALKQEIRAQIAAEKTTFKVPSYTEQFFSDLPDWLRQASKSYYYSSVDLQTNLHQLNLVPIYSRWLNSPLDPDELLPVPPDYVFLNYLSPTTTTMTNVPDALIFVDRGWKRIPGGANLPLGYRQQQNRVWVISPKHALLASFTILPPMPKSDTQTNSFSSSIRVLPMSDQELLDTLWKRIKIN